MERRFAVLIGNDQFADPAIPRLNAPVQDVESLRGVLEDRQIGGFDILADLVNLNTRDVLVGVSRLAKQATFHDTILLYYSGHGILDESGKLYLAANDTDVSLLTATGIPAQFVAQEFDQCTSARQIIILDCCNSGAFDRNRKGTHVTRANSASAFEGVREGRGRYLLCATDETRYAYDQDVIPGAKNSLFTHFLVEGLRTGDGDIDQDGHISLDDLHSYIAMKIQEHGFTQEPYKWTYKANGKVFLARNVRSRGFDIRSLSSLPDDIQSSIVSRTVDIRLGVIAALSKLVRDDDKAIAENSRLALAHLSGDPDTNVSTAAASAVRVETQIYTVPTVRALGRDRSSHVFDEKTLFVGPNVPLRMIRIPGGKFLMGSRQDERGAQELEFPQHAVDLDEYWIAAGPITIQQFAEFVNSSNYVPLSERADTVRKAFSRHSGVYEKISNTWRDPFGKARSRSTTKEHPVVLISWFDAIAFCKWASAVTGLQVDLPTEAQWEKAARGVDGRSWPWGNKPPDNTLANFDERNRQTTPVGTYSPAGDSPYGCIDMAGNVWEWTNSQTRSYPFADEYDGSSLSLSGKRVLRGGSWRVKGYRLRCAFRKPWAIGECIDGHGFRIISQ